MEQLRVLTKSTDTLTVKEMIMTKPLVQIGDEVREMTDVEYEQHIKDVEKSRLELEASEEKAEAKVALLKRLGITADEAALLLG
jgi:hypothetical protein